MIVQFGIIGIMIFGDKVFPAIGMQPPDMYEQVRDKKFAVGQSCTIKSALSCFKLSHTQRLTNSCCV